MTTGTPCEVAILPLHPQSGWSSGYRELAFPTAG
jgi:hypothetical protein